MKPDDDDPRRDTIVDNAAIPERFFDDSPFADRAVAPAPELRWVTEWRTEYAPELVWNGRYWDQALVPTLVPVQVPVFG